MDFTLYFTYIQHRMTFLSKISFALCKFQNWRKRVKILLKVLILKNILAQYFYERFSIYLFLNSFMLKREGQNAQELSFYFIWVKSAKKIFNTGNSPYELFQTKYSCRPIREIWHYYCMYFVLFHIVNIPFYNQ